MYKSEIRRALEALTQDYYTGWQAAEVLGISRQTLSNWIARKRFEPDFSLVANASGGERGGGRLVFYSKDRIDRLAKARAQQEGQ